MNILSTTILSAATALTVSVGAAFIATAPAQAAGLSNPAALSQTLLQDGSEVIKVQRRRGRGRRGRGRRFYGGGRHRPYYGGYYGRHYNCYWTVKRRWSSYYGHYIRRKVRICY